MKPDTGSPNRAPITITIAGVSAKRKPNEMIAYNAEEIIATRTVDKRAPLFAQTNDIGIATINTAPKNSEFCVPSN
ncbi:hypothetical protein D3C86_1923240 [compost metagenome]